MNGTAVVFGLSEAEWAAVSAVSAAATALIALVAAAVALYQLRQSRELSEDQARPYVIAYLQESEADWSLTDFVVKNIGSTAARDLTVTVDPPYKQAKPIPGAEFMSAAFLQQPTGTLAPGQELRTFLDSGRDILEVSGDSVAQPFEVTLRYLDRRGRPQEDRFPINPRMGHGSIRIDVHGLHHIAKTLRAWTSKQGIHSY